MNRLKIMLVIIIAGISILSQVENASAQTRVRQRVARKVVRHDVRVARRVRHTVVVRRAHIRYAGLPKWGATVNVVPTAAIVVRGGNVPYYFHQGVYYTARNTSYVVVRPARGMRIKVLPIGFRTIALGSKPYFYYYGTFYIKTTNNEYEVMDAPQGAIVDALPDGYEIKNINGTEYYVLDNAYYAEVDAPEFEDGVGYEVVKIKY